jgi:hypothetical protein
LRSPVPQVRAMVAMALSHPADNAQGDVQWRRLLWLSHGCPVSGLYGDDGEMSCGHCTVDFKRMDAQEIGDLWKRRGLDELRKAPNAKSGEQRDGEIESIEMEAERVTRMLHSVPFGLSYRARNLIAIMLERIRKAPAFETDGQQ